MNNFLTLSIKKSFLVISFLYSEFSIAQSWIFELKPGTKYYSINTFRTNGTIINSSTVLYKQYTAQTIRKIQFEPEIYVNILQLAPMWKLGFGFSIYNFSSTINASSSGKTTIQGVDQSLLYTEIIDRSIFLNFSQFMINVEKTFKTKPEMDKIMKNKIGFEIGLNKASIFNSTYEKQYFSSYIQNNKGYLKQIQYTKSKIFGQFSPFFILKYEVTFFNHKNKSGFINLYFSYLQGFVNQYDFTLESSSLDNAYMHLRSKLRGSGFRLGISKTFSFKKNNKNEVIE